MRKYSLSLTQSVCWRPILATVLALLLAIPDALVAQMQQSPQKPDPAMQATQPRANEATSNPIADAPSAPMATMEATPPRLPLPSPVTSRSWRS